jgi:hypothetical protein
MEADSLMNEGVDGGKTKPISGLARNKAKHFMTGGGVPPVCLSH